MDGMLTNDKNVIIPELGGEVEHVEYKAPTTTEEGNIEYWHCVTENGCDQYWADEARTQLINRKRTILPKLEAQDIFEDVKPDRWYTDAIYYCYNNGYMAGLSDTVFGYKNTVTRAMFVTILAKIDGSDLSAYEGKSSFSDVKTDGWYTAAIEWAYQNGYAAGLGDGIFGYKADVSREQIALFFYTYSTKVGVDVSAKADISGFADYDRIHDWALDAVAWAVEAGLIEGTGENYVSPRASATRSEIAVIVMNYVENIKNAVVETPAE
jgi:hypothetical protein